MSDRRLRLMSAQTIVRLINTRTREICDIQAAKSEHEKELAFALRAKKELGYTDLAQAFTQKTFTIPPDVVLLKALHELGIRPLDRKSVEDYQNRLVTNLQNRLVKLLGLSALITGIVGSIVILIAALNAPQATLLGMYQIHWIWPTLLGIGFTFVWMEHAFIPRMQWDVSSLNTGHNFRTSKPSLLPREVLDLALRVKEAVPEAQLYIHALSRDHGPWFKVGEYLPKISFDPDPFLEVRFAAESYFIAVWDEPGYSGKLMKIE